MEALGSLSGAGAGGATAGQAATAIGQGAGMGDLIDKGIIKGDPAVAGGMQQQAAISPNNPPTNPGGAMASPYIQDIMRQLQTPQQPRRPMAATNPPEGGAQRQPPPQY